MINPWDESLRDRGMIKQLQDLAGIAAVISHTANTIFALHGQICRLADSIYLEANKDRTSFSLAGFREDMDTECRKQEEKDHRDSMAEHEKGHPLTPYIVKDTFLELCAQIYDQKEVVYVDREE